jgi:hypothetical protein
MMNRAAPSSPFALSPRARKTWSIRLPRSSRVLVPVQLDALVVRKSEGTWADCAMREPTDSNLTEDLRPPPFATREPRSRGIYLHWALPDALTRGRQPEQGDTTRFPAIPDRWLVTRIAVGTRGRSVRGWVLLGGGRQGKAIPVDDFVEPGPDAAPLQPLTALGHGDPAWAAYFDNVVNRLSFYDPLDDLATGPVAYLVCGWHADAALDPLGEDRIPTPSALAARLGELGWSLPGTDLENAGASTIDFLKRARALDLPLDREREAFWPRLSLYHGSVVGLAWPGTDLPGEHDGLLGGEVGGPPPAASVRVAIGRSSAEAFAALRRLPQTDARLLEAFHQGLLDELDGADARAKIDARLHAASFTSISGGEAKEQVWQPPEPPLPPGRPPSRGIDHVVVDGFRDLRLASETQLLSGNVTAVAEAVSPPPEGVDQPQPGTTGRWVELTVPAPRFYYPGDPVLVLEGARRSFKHGGDGRFSDVGLLACRATGQALRDIKTVKTRTVAAHQILERGVENGSIPPECEELLGELAILDPGSADVIARLAVAGEEREHESVARALRAEQSAWWSLRAPRRDGTLLAVKSGLGGTLPSPLAVSAPTQPWVPLHVDWRVEYWPTPRGERDFSLGAVDFAPRDGTSPPLERPPGAVVLEGRSLLTPATAERAGSAARGELARAARIGTAVALPVLHRARFASDVVEAVHGAISGLSVNGGSELVDVASALSALDLLTAPLDPLQAGLRGGFAADAELQGGEPRPQTFVPIEAGWLRLTKLRLVDCFGQVLDLVTDAAPANVVWSEPISVDRADVGLLAPRITAPSRLTLRYQDARGTARDADHEVSPLCGFIQPNHLDASLDVFAADGAHVGALRYDDADLAWEDAPGRPAVFGSAPERALANPYLAGLCRGLLDFGALDRALPPERAREGVLAAFLRLIDASLWSVDPFGSVGEEHLSLLLGHPLAVLRARVVLEVREPFAAPELRRARFPCRLGALEHFHDGLLGFFVGDDYRMLHVPPAVAAEAREIGPGQGFLRGADSAGSYLDEIAHARKPVTHPFVDASGLIWLTPGEEQRLTLLVEPHALVHASCGILPRKELAMRREWVAPGLARLGPAFRFGPVLVDPKRIRMPVPNHVAGSFSWDHRSALATWSRSDVAHATGEAQLPLDPVQASEGWLHLMPPDASEEPNA